MSAATPIATLHGSKLTFIYGRTIYSQIMCRVQLTFSWRFYWSVCFRPEAGMFTHEVPCRYLHWSSTKQIAETALSLYDSSDYHNGYPVSGCSYVANTSSVLLSHYYSWKNGQLHGGPHFPRDIGTCMVYITYYIIILYYIISSLHIPYSFAGILIWRIGEFFT